MTVIFNLQHAARGLARSPMEPESATAPITLIQDWNPEAKK